MKQKTGFISYFRKNYFAYFLILPTALYLLIFQIYPLLETVRLSFTNTHLVRDTSDYVGFQNYITLLTQDPKFWKIVLNSLIFVLIPIITQFMFAIPAALVLNAKIACRGLWRGLVMVPWVMPMVVVGIMMKWLLDYHYGLINYYMKALHLVSTSLDWFGDEKLVFFTLIMASTWKGFAYPTVMILAGLKGIPHELYESSHVDGAGGIRKFWYITLPLIKPILFVSGAVTLITGWTKFEMVYVLTSGGPGYATSTLPVYIFTNSFNSFRMGIGSTVAVISTIIVLIFTAIYWKSFMGKE